MEISTRPQLALASTSPRRRELLAQLNLRVLAVGIDVDESLHVNEQPHEYVVRVAAMKAAAGASKVEDQRLPVLGADTSVVIDGEVLGKPLNHADGATMLNRLSGRWHEVITGVVVLHEGKQYIAESTNRVLFRPLTTDEIEWYWSTGEPHDKAGAYAIQGLAAQFIERLEGSYSGVMGLPLFETSKLLSEAGVRLQDAVTLG